MKNLLILLPLLFAFQMLAAQTLHQVVRGQVVDNVSKASLPGATVALYEDSSLVYGELTDENGYFRMPEVPLGRYTLVVSYVGYESWVLPELTVQSAKESVLSIELEPSAFELEGIEIRATEQGEAQNEMAMVSARAFSVEETDRYPGSRGDPARMAANFAGVQGNDDSNNGIVVRGNSPYFLTWRLENVTIPSPNHFIVIGRANGPISVLNNKYLATSDFYTGAFPAKLGNSIGSAFDLRMRPGNDEKVEFTGQLGLFGTEVSAEGPISKKDRSSFLFNYRYSTVSIFQTLGLDIGTDAKPTYMDGAFKLNFPGKNNSNFSIFGLGGYSTINDVQSAFQDTSKINIYSPGTSDQYYTGRMGVLGANYSKTLNPSTYISATLAGTHAFSWNVVDDVWRHIENGEFVVDSITPQQAFNYTVNKTILSAFLNKKLGGRHVLHAGFEAEMQNFALVDSTYLRNAQEFITRNNYFETNYLVQPFAQWQYKLHPDWTMNIGLHGLYWDFNGSWSVEPRGGVEWRFADNQSLAYGFGMHSQTVMHYSITEVREDAQGNEELIHKHLDLMRSIHNVLSYSIRPSRYLRVLAEAYHQHLYNIPIQVQRSSYSLLTQGEDNSDYVPDDLISEGIARNVGLELTLEKFFHKNFYFLFTGSLYDARYLASDGNWYNSAFNGNYSINLSAGKAFTWGKRNKSTLTFGAHVIAAGGKRSTPLDVPASIAAGMTVVYDSLRNTEQLKDYFRTDIRIEYRLNTKKVTHEIGIDLFNTFDTQNILRQVYVAGDPPIRDVHQLGFLPVFYYRIDI